MIGSAHIIAFLSKLYMRKRREELCVEVEGFNLKLNPHELVVIS